MKAWLFTICRHSCIDCRRRLTLETLDTSHPTLATVAAQQHGDQQRRTDLLSILQEELDNLCDNEREAFILVHVHGHSREQAAEIVGVPASTMRRRTNRAREHLAQRLRLSRVEAGER